MKLILWWCSNYPINNSCKTHDHDLVFGFYLWDTIRIRTENYQDIKNLDDLRDHTTVIEIPNTERLIIQAY